QPAPEHAHTVLIRRSVTDPCEIEFFLAHAPLGTPITELIKLAGLRWKIEENNAQSKDLLGLTQYQVRKWTPWHRHVTTVMLALAFLAVTQTALPDNTAPADQGKDRQPPPQPPGTTLPSPCRRPRWRRSAASWPGCSSPPPTPSNTSWPGQPSAASTRPAPGSAITGDVEIHYLKICECSTRTPCTGHCGLSRRDRPRSPSGAGTERSAAADPPQPAPPCGRPSSSRRIHARIAPKSRENLWTNQSCPTRTTTPTPYGTAIFLPDAAPNCHAFLTHSIRSLRHARLHIWRSAESGLPERQASSIWSISWQVKRKCWSFVSIWSPETASLCLFLRNSSRSW